MGISLDHYSVSLSDGSRTIISDITYHFGAGTTTYLLGKNGSGKSTLLLSLAGAPQYTSEGSLEIQNREMIAADTYERTQCGLMIALQSIPSIPGVKYLEFLRTIYTQKIQRENPEFKISPFLFRRILDKHLKDLHISSEMLDRDVNVGFSGGEKRRMELLQIRLLDPQYILFDEIESGLDLGAMDLLVEEIKQLRMQGKTLIIVTHSLELIERCGGDMILILSGGEITGSSNYNDMQKKDLAQYFEYTPHA